MVASPYNNYTYDALYRLVIEQGSEYGAAGAPTFDDGARRGFSVPSDGSAMVSYREYYTYDEVGNMLQMQHIAPGSGSWTRSFTIDTAATIFW